MTTLEDRFLSSYHILERLGRAKPDGTPVGNAIMETLAPDQWRIISEACFGYLWNRPALTVEQRSLATVSALVALRRDDNLKGHLFSALDVGLPPEQVTEIMLQLIFYVGAPMANTALWLVHDVLQERGIKPNPHRVFDTTEDPQKLYDRGLEMRRRVLGDAEGGPSTGDQLDQDWDRYLLEYLWGSVWPRPGLDLQQRCLCTLTALAALGDEPGIRTYVGAALRLGLTQDEIRELFLQLTFYIGVTAARTGHSIAAEVFGSV